MLVMKATLGRTEKSGPEIIYLFAGTGSMTLGFTKLKGHIFQATPAPVGASGAITQSGRGTASPLREPASPPDVNNLVYALYSHIPEEIAVVEGKR